MSKKKDEFAAGLFSQWLPSFCNARDESVEPEGFVMKNLNVLSEFDASWFMDAIEEGYVDEANGFFTSDLSQAKETILWADSVVAGSRRIHLWLEPIITIGALARLIKEYRWPQTQVGLQSKAPWPFDLMGYGTDRETELLACEVKKTTREMGSLIEGMAKFSATSRLERDPTNPVAKNAYRKVVGIRKSWPHLFWAVGPDGQEEVFEVVRSPGSEIFSLSPTSPDSLRFPLKL